VEDCPLSAVRIAWVILGPEREEVRGEWRNTNLIYDTRSPVLKMEDCPLSAVRSYPYQDEIDVGHITAKKFVYPTRLWNKECRRREWGLADSSLIVSCDVIVQTVKYAAQGL